MCGVHINVTFTFICHVTRHVTRITHASRVVCMRTCVCEYWDECVWVFGWKHIWVSLWMTTRKSDSLRVYVFMGWLRLVGSLESEVSFEKEAHMSESLGKSTFEWLIACVRVYAHAYEVCVSIWMKTLMSEYLDENTYEQVTSHKWMRHVTHMDEFFTYMHESWHKYMWVKSHV